MAKGKVFGGGSVSYEPYNCKEVAWAAGGYFEFYGPGNSPFTLSVTTPASRAEAKALIALIQAGVKDGERGEAKRKAKLAAQSSKVKAIRKKLTKKSEKAVKASPKPVAAKKSKAKKSQPWND